MSADGDTTRAILLAAGRGRRLEQAEPKCLLEIGGQTLLARHLVNMKAAGIEQLTIVVGYEQQQIRDFIARHDAPFAVDFIENPAFQRGSIVSLQVASELLIDGAIWMDADVLYPADLLGRLVRSRHDACVLLDRRSEETGEEMMLGARDKRVRMIARKVKHAGPWDVVGEAVGFAKVTAKHGKKMKRILDSEVEAGRLDQEYEAAMNIAFDEFEWGYEVADDVAWTEIDFREDVEKAERLLADGQV